MADKESEMFDERFERLRERFEASSDFSTQAEILEAEARRSAGQVDFEERRAATRERLGGISSKASAEMDERRVSFESGAAAMKAEGEALRTRHRSMERRLKQAPQQELLAKAGVADLEESDDV